MAMAPWIALGVNLAKLSLHQALIFKGTSVNLGTYCSCCFASGSEVSNNFPLKEKVAFSCKTEMTSRPG